MATAIIPILSLLSGVGGFLGNKAPKTTTTSQSAGENTSSGTSLPVYDPLNQQLRDTLIEQYRNSLYEDPDLSGYKANGIAQLQQSRNSRTQAISNSLASRGLSNSPIAAIAPALSEGQGVGDISSFINSIPLLADSLRQQKLAAAGGFEKGLPVGQTQWGDQKTSSQQSGTQVGSGSPLGGAVTSAATTAAGLYGKLLS